MAGPGGGPYPAATASRTPSPRAGRGRQRHRAPRRDDEDGRGERRCVRQRLRPRRRRQGRRLRPARQRLARGQRGGGRDRRRHGQDRRQPARRPDARHVPDPPLDQFITPDRSRSSARRSTTPARSSARSTLYAFDESQPARQASATTSRSAATPTTSIHTGPGEDLANGNAGDDRIWLGDNFTAHDRGQGQGAGLLAHRPRRRRLGRQRPRPSLGRLRRRLPRRPAALRRRLVAGPDADERPGDVVPDRRRRGVAQRRRSTRQENFEGIDYLYGGWDQDTMQANEGDNGPKPGDRLLDWAGVLQRLLPLPVHVRRLGLDPRRSHRAWSRSCRRCRRASARRRRPPRGSSGFRETAIVFPNEHGKNTNPVHPDTPAHFTCGPGVTIP